MHYNLKLLEQQKAPNTMLHNGALKQFSAAFMYSILKNCYKPCLQRFLESRVILRRKLPYQWASCHWTIMLLFQQIQVGTVSRKCRILLLLPRNSIAIFRDIFHWPAAHFSRCNIMESGILYVTLNWENDYVASCLYLALKDAEIFIFPHTCANLYATQIYHI